MQFKQTLAALVFFVAAATAQAQTTYLPQGAKENILLERLEIKLGRDSVLNFSKNKPFSRKQYIQQLSRVDSGVLTSAADKYNWYSAMANNLEWASGSRTDYTSKRPLGKTFYQTPANFYETYSEDFFLAVNPVLQLNLSKEADNDATLFQNTRGIALRGRIANKVGFSAYVTENQERTPRYVQQWVVERRAVPGAGFYQEFKGDGYDYFDARGTITFNAAKYIDIAFGYDRNFIGNGHRSLFLSDFSNNTVFLKLNTRIWKFNYQNLFMELSGANRQPASTLYPKKYAAMHHLDIALAKWLNVGLFEGIIFGRKDKFDFGYLNPVIFYRSIEQQNGSFDNAVAGFDAKANVAKSFQFYTQFLLDEFNLGQIRKRDGWWANKWALQLGAKYIDAFGISNLDLQGEINRVRPFTYSHGDSIANYSHYNQPLAHPLGANFNELIGIARYQPAPRWMLQAKAIYYSQGKDVDSVNWGGNILLPNRPPFRTRENGFEIGGGARTKTAYASLLLSYELKQNLFIEGNAVVRKVSSESALIPSNNTVIISAGIRWNMHRREFDF